MNQFILVVKSCCGPDILCTTYVIDGLFDLFRAINCASDCIFGFPYSDKFTVICLDDGIHYPFSYDPVSLRSLRQTLILKYCHCL